MLTLQELRERCTELEGHTPGTMENACKLGRQREEHLAGFMRGATIIDGVDQYELKDWLECVSTAFCFISDLTVDEARRGLAKVSRGALRQAILEYTGDHPTLNSLVDWIKSTCVTRDRFQDIHEVETYRQGPTQPLQHYIAQYRARVGRAYLPTDLANELIVTQLIRHKSTSKSHERNKTPRLWTRPILLQSRIKGRLHGFGLRGPRNRWTSGHYAHHHLNPLNLVSTPWRPSPKLSPNN